MYNFPAFTELAVFLSTITLPIHVFYWGGNSFYWREMTDILPLKKMNLRSPLIIFLESDRTQAWQYSFLHLISFVSGCLFAGELPFLVRIMLKNARSRYVSDRADLIFPLRLLHLSQGAVKRPWRSERRQAGVSLAYLQHHWCVFWERKTENSLDS